MKFGIGRTTSDTAHEIRDGVLTREEGIKLIKKYDSEYPLKYEKEFLEYCGITKEELVQFLDSWRAEHLWEKTNDGWNLKYKIWE